ncbi:hypothetical protein [Bradyrhizobium sp.]|uniref:hypothetical protein n=1 Tax=Bradyrhizobium sp. TaxID=376 RepID=UPI003430863B
MLQRNPDENVYSPAQEHDSNALEVLVRKKLGRNSCEVASSLKMAPLTRAGIPNLRSSKLTMINGQRWIWATLKVEELGKHTWPLSLK